MKIANKYNMSEEDFNRMVKDGVVGCQWVRWESLYNEYKKGMSMPGAVKTRVISVVAAKENVSERHVWEIISRFE
jgi:hypothetical protein